MRHLVRFVTRGAETLVCFTALALGACPQVHADSPAIGDVDRSDQVKTLEKGSSTKASRLEAQKRLALDQLDAASRRRVEAVIESTSLFREMPTVAFEVEPEVYRYFLQRPEMAVAVWKGLGISKFELKALGNDRFQADVGDGTAGTIEVLHRTDDTCLILCDGSFKAPLSLKAIRSQCVLQLETQFFKTQDGRQWAKHRALMFVSFPSHTVEATAKVISPISNVIVDHNFREISLFLRMMTLAMQKQPGWVERVTQKMDGTPEASKVDLLKLTAHVYLQSRRKELAKNGVPEETSVEEILAPLHKAHEARKAITPASAQSPASSAHKALPGSGRP